MREFLPYRRRNSSRQYSDSRTIRDRIRPRGGDSARLLFWGSCGLRGGIRQILLPSGCVSFGAKTGDALAVLPQLLSLRKPCHKSELLSLMRLLRFERFAKCPPPLNPNVRYVLSWKLSYKCLAYRTCCATFILFPLDWPRRRGGVNQNNNPTNTRP